MKFKKKDTVKGHLTIVMAFSGEALLVQSEMKKKKIITQPLIRLSLWSPAGFPV